MVNNIQNHIIKDKIYFAKEIRQIIPINKNFKINVNIGDKIKENTIIAYKEVKPIIKTVNINGTPLVKEGQKVQKGQILSQKGKFIKRKVKSKYDGTVKEVTNEYVKILLDNDQDNKPSKIISQVDGIVENIFKEYVVIKYSAVIVNAFYSKGSESWGTLEYISSETFNDTKNLDKNLKGKIILTDYLTEEMYPILVTKECAGVITNSVDYDIYNNIILLSIPIVVHSGFSLKYKLAEDLPFTSFVRNNKNLKAFIDTKYNRVVIPVKYNTKPKFLTKYEFNLKHIGVII